METFLIERAPIIGSPNEYTVLFVRKETSSAPGGMTTSGGLGIVGRAVAVVVEALRSGLAVSSARGAAEAGTETVVGDWLQAQVQKDDKRNRNMKTRI